MNPETIYQSITNRIVTAIEQGGVPPWRKPWVASAGNAPRNAITGAPYRGVNLFLLASCTY